MCVVVLCLALGVWCLWYSFGLVFGFGGGFGFLFVVWGFVACLRGWLWCFAWFVFVPWCFRVYAIDGDVSWWRVVVDDRFFLLVVCRLLR